MSFVRILSKVDFPAPLWPIMPSASPFSISKDTSRSAQKSPSCSSIAGVAPRSTRRTTDGTRSRRLSCRSPRRNFFQTPSIEMARSLIRSSDVFGEEMLQAAEHQRGAEHTEDREGSGVDELPRIPCDALDAFHDHGERHEQVVPLDDREAQPFEDSGERIEHRDVCALRAEHRRLEEDRREENPEHEHDLHDVLHISEKEISAAEKERDAGGEEKEQYEQEWHPHVARVQANAEEREDDDERDQPDRCVEGLRADGGEREHLAREVD